MTENAAEQELSAGLEDLERDAVDGDGEDLRAQVEAQLQKWRQWIDELVVQADLGRLDVRDDLRELVQKVENSYLALKNEAEKAIDRNQGRGEQVQKAIDRNQGRGEQVQKAATDAAGDLKDGLVKASGDLRAAARSALDQLRKAG